MRRLWVTLAVIGAVAISVSIWGASRAIAARRLRAELDQVKSDLQSNLFSTARERLLRLEKEFPGNGEVEYQLGVCEEARDRREEAMRAWSRVPAQSPFASVAAAKRATILTNLGRYSEAESVLESVRSSPSSYELDQAVARLYRLEGRLDEVRRIVRASWGRAPFPAAVLRNLWTHDKSPFPVESWEERALNNADQNDDRVWLARAVVATLTGRFDDAARWLAACEKKRPNDPAVWRARLNLARAAEDVEGARTALEHLAAEPFSELEVLTLRAWFEAARGDADAERKTLTSLVERYPGNTRAWERLATLAFEAGQLKEAERLRRRKAEIDEAQDRYRKLLFLGDEPSNHFDEFARLAEKMGRRAESHAWSLLREQGSSDRPTGEALPEDEDGEIAPNAPRKPGALALAGLLNDLRTRQSAGSATAPPPIPSSATPEFVDDAGAAHLSKFVFENGQTPQRQLPETMTGGVGVLDYDGDGWLDVYVVQGGPLAAPTTASIGDRLFRNNHDGTFTDVSEPSRIVALQGGFGLAVTVGDYDNDGDPDLFVSRLQSYALYRNKGDGTFEDATRASGLAGVRDNPTSAAFADLDGDGDLDLYVCHYMLYDPKNPRLCLSDKGEYFYCDPGKVDPAPDHVFRNDGGRFVDVTAEAGFVDPRGRGLGVVAVDVDNDHKIDLFVANDGTANYLFHNLGGFKFEEVGELSGVASSETGAFKAGMGVAAADLDDDGLPELMVTNFYGEGATLYKNLGGLLFTDRSVASGLGAGTRYRLGFGMAPLDFDNDGRTDLMVVNGHVNDNRPSYPYAMPAQLFAGGPNGRLVEVSERAGPPWKVLHVGRGLAIGDLDNDGRADALVLSQNEPLAYFHNRTKGGHFLVLRLIGGPKSNRDAIGATVTVHAAGRRQVLQRFGGGSYQSGGDLRVHVGLGTATRAESIEVRWPSGAINTYRNIMANTGYTLREGESKAQSLAGFRDK